MQPIEWRPVVGYENYYEVSSEGDVRSIATTRGHYPRMKAQQRERNGYLRVRLSLHGQSKNHWVHRLVCVSFHGVPTPGLEARHGNGVRTDNRAANLSWGTKADNMQDAVRHGTNANTAKTSCKRGHPFDDADTGYRLSGNRYCRKCNVARVLESRARRRIQTRA